MATRDASAGLKQLRFGSPFSHGKQLLRNSLLFFHNLQVFVESYTISIVDNAHNCLLREQRSSRSATVPFLESLVIHQAISALLALSKGLSLLYDQLATHHHWLGSIVVLFGSHPVLT